MEKIKEVDITRREIEERLTRVGDYVKMDFLSQCLKKQLDFDTRRFVLITLSAIYESRKMYLEAAKLIRAAADINTTFESKMNDFSKATELFIKAVDFDNADISFGKALVSANERQKIGLKIKMKETYKAQAKEFILKDKRKHAMDTYEKLLTLDLDSLEKKEVQHNLIKLYEKLGKVKEYYALQKAL